MVVVGIGLGEQPEIFRSQARQGLVMGGYVGDVARRERIAESYPDSWLDEEPGACHPVSTEFEDQ